MALHDLDIRIDRLVLEIGASPGGAASGRALVEAALKKVAERLAGSPFHAQSLGPIVLERLSIGTLSAADLLGRRGAERLADELYAELARRLG
jgi:hypothetical protein